MVLIFDTSAQRANMSNKNIALENNVQSVILLPYFVNHSKKTWANAVLTSTFLYFCFFSISFPFH